jgi:hypothetical protein
MGDNGQRGDERRSLSRKLVRAGEVAFALATIIGLIVLVRDLAEPDAPSRRGEIRVTSIETRVRLGEFLRRKERLGRSVGQRSDIPDFLRGTVVEYRLSADGFRGETLTTRWSLYDLRQRRQVGLRSTWG